MRMQRLVSIPRLAFLALCLYGISYLLRSRHSNNSDNDAWHYATTHSTMGNDNDACRICNGKLFSAKTIGLDQMSTSGKTHFFQHQFRCPIENRTPFGDHSDAAKRVADVYSLHRIADPYGNIGSWIACALSNGESDMALYDSKSDAIRHQHHNENYYTYIQIVPAMMTSCESEVMLKVARMAYDVGLRVTDGLSKNELIRRLGWEDQIALSKGYATNVRYGRN